MTDRRALFSASPLGLVRTSIALAAISLAAGYAIAWIPGWPCALLEHFRLQYMVIGAVVAALAAALRVRRSLAVAAIATVLHGLPVAADLWRAPQAGPADGVAIRVLLLNVLTENTAYDRVRQLIADEQPDLVGLVEVNRRWLDGVAPAVAGYERIEAQRPDNFGVALYARGSLAGRIEYLGGELPSAVAEVEVRGARLRVLLVHPPPPMSRAVLAAGMRQLAAIGDRARSDQPTIVMGDFNATPWSRPFAEVGAHSGLCDSRAGFGIQASFPSATAALRIPIDHLLASCSIGVRDRQIGPDVGSDHLPVIVDLVVPRAP